MKNILFYLLLVITFSFPIYAEKIDELTATSNQESVVCLHSFLGSHKSLKPMGHALAKEGFDVYLWDYESRKFTIEEHGAHLTKLLNELAKRHPNQPIHFVSHSAGGLVIRAALSRDDCPKEAKYGKAMLLAPPNLGSRLARRYKDEIFVKMIFGTKMGYQLMTYSEQEMQNIGCFPVTKDVFVITGSKESHFIPFKMSFPNDGKICIDETCLSTFHKRHLIYASHAHIVARRETIDITTAFFKGPSFERVREAISRAHIYKCSPDSDGRATIMCPPKKARSKEDLHQSLTVVSCLASSPMIVHLPPQKTSVSKDMSKTNVKHPGESKIEKQQLEEE
ncbi:esterase/lipase family protein [Candidatus Clavichlamydia salmonicola]|uniref:esterase/lipase family protein n=1 Tax=Candidatus Clavichlamydia salmonicola TaxID=469812 RepID=UPI001890BCC0|nr:alpha/beta hydrolase [Candidatus Clavichlamydia salmonicola]